MGPDGDLAPLGAEHVAGDTHHIADVVLLEPVEGGFLHLVNLHIELDSAGAVLQIAEKHLAHAPLAHEAAGQRNGLALQGIEVVLDFLGGGGNLILGLLEGVEALPAEIFQLLPANPHLVADGNLLLGYKLCHAQPSRVTLTTTIS